LEGFVTVYGKYAKLDNNIQLRFVIAAKV